MFPIHLSLIRIAAGPATVADTKAKFTRGYPYPLPSIWATVTQECTGRHALYHDQRAVPTRRDAKFRIRVGLRSVVREATRRKTQASRRRKRFSNAFMEAAQPRPEEVEGRCRRSCRRLHRSKPASTGSSRDPMFASMKSKVESKSLVYDKFIARIGFFQALEMSKQASQENLKAISEASGVEIGED